MIWSLNCYYFIKQVKIFDFLNQSQVPYFSDAITSNRDRFLYDQNFKSVLLPCLRKLSLPTMPCVAVHFLLSDRLKLFIRVPSHIQTFQTKIFSRHKSCRILIKQSWCVCAAHSVITDTLAEFPTFRRSLKTRWEMV